MSKNYEGETCYVYLRDFDSHPGDGHKHLRALLVELPKAKAVDDYEALLPWRLAIAER